MNRERRAPPDQISRSDRSVKLDLGDGFEWHPIVGPFRRQNLKTGLRQILKVAQAVEGC